MATCIKLSRTKTEVCIGNMTKRISIFTRALTTPSDPTGFNVDYTESFTLLSEVWAMLQTPKGQTIFDGLGVEKIISDVFYIRYIDGLTSENWITYDGNRYDIQMVEDIEQNNLFQQLSCVVRGDDTLSASQS